MMVFKCKVASGRIVPTNSDQGRMGTRRPATRNDLLLISGRFNENVGTRTVLAAGRSLGTGHVLERWRWSSARRRRREGNRALSGHDQRPHGEPSFPKCRSWRGAVEGGARRP